MKYRLLVLVAGCFFLFSACASQPVKEVGFVLPRDLANRTVIKGAEIGVVSYADRGAAKAAFGFDVIGAGLLPVQVVFDNRGDQTFRIDVDQTLLMNQDRRAFNILSSSTAYQRIEKKGGLARLGMPTAKGAALGAVTGAIIGAAVGVVSGDNVGNDLGKGAAVGGAAGAVLGGGSTMTPDAGEDARSQVTEDIDRRSLDNKDILPGRISHGFLFFPAEAGIPKSLILKVLDKNDGILYTHEFSLSAPR